MAFLAGELGKSVGRGIDVAEAFPAAGYPHEGAAGVIGPVVVRAGEPAGAAEPSATVAPRCRHALSSTRIRRSAARTTMTGVPGRSRVRKLPGSATAEPGVSKSGAVNVVRISAPAMAGSV
jgi:hypothetical protein